MQVPSALISTSSTSVIQSTADQTYYVEKSYVAADIYFVIGLWWLHP